MLVSDIQGDATAATLGAQKTTAMGMVDDAAFLMMLATNLYSNQKLACIRETMCNAWDAHIEAGTTHIPVKVVITEENELVIEDSGLGISEDLFEQIYGTFGGSTKRNNKAVTGGFGLGCKSPWAYTESFRVISESQGKKVVYNLTRASVEAEGKPAITRVMVMPTERSGLTVRFPLAEDDVRIMLHYIQAIACHGDMLVHCTHEKVDVTGGSILDRLGLDPTPGSYNIEDSKWYFHYMGNHDWFVRYGAVIYPMLDTPGTKKALDLVREFMKIVGFKRMVVQSAPGTLALTPNREALSSSKMTEDGLTNLCVDLVARIEADIIKQIPGSVLQAVERLAKGDSAHTSLERRADIMEAITPVSVRRYLNSTLGAAKLAKYSSMLREAEHRGFKNTNTFVNKAATRQYHRLRSRIQGAHWKQQQDMKTAFAKHYVLRPLSRIFQKHVGLLQLEQFFNEGHFFNNSNRRESLLTYVNVESHAYLQQMIDTPTVFITSRSKELHRSIKCCPHVTFTQATWVYRIVPNAKNKDAVIKAFEDSGMKVIDLTLNHEWDVVAAELEAARLRRSAGAKAGATTRAAGGKKTPNAMMSLSNVYNDETGLRTHPIGSIKVMNKVDLQTTDTPVFYVPVEGLRSEGEIGRFGHYLDLTDDERKHGVIVRSGTEKNMAIKRGAKHVDAYLAQRLWDKVNSKEYAEYRTKLRKNSLYDEHHINAEHIEMLEFLGVKLAGVDKLIVDPAMERAADLVHGTTALDFSREIPAITLEEMTHYKDVISHYKLDALPFIVMLKTLKADDMLGRLLFWGSNVMDLIKQFPERKPALKALVMSVIKHGTENE
jgi:hypothetical protein